MENWIINYQNVGNEKWDDSIQYLDQEMSLTYLGALKLPSPSSDNAS